MWSVLRTSVPVLAIRDDNTPRNCELHIMSYVTKTHRQSLVEAFAEQAPLPLGLNEVKECVSERNLVLTCPIALGQTERLQTASPAYDLLELLPHFASDNLLSR
jgi:hypothetical protein